MNLTKNSMRRQAIYDFICSYTQDKGYGPSVREIGDAVGLRSPSTVHAHLQNLQKEGLILIDPRKSRTISLPHLTKKNNSSDIFDPVPVAEYRHNEAVLLPLVGQIAAGSPILAEQNIEDYLALPRQIADDRASYVLKVRGDSMTGAGILDGDYIVVRETPDAQNGDTVVALIGDEATVKTFYRENNRIRLQPENDAYEPIYAENPRILGKVCGLFRRVV